MIERLAQVALSRIVATDMKARLQEQRPTSARACACWIRPRRDGGGRRRPATIDEEITAVERELKETVGDIEARASLATLDGSIGASMQCTRFEQFLSLTHTPSGSTSSA